MLVGTVDLFDRHIEMDLSKGFFAEIIPTTPYQPLAFVLDEKFLMSPPLWCDVYHTFDGAILYARHFLSCDQRQKMIAQTNFCGNLVTIFYQGDLQLAVEGRGFRLTPLSLHFAHPALHEQKIDGRPFLVIEGKGALAILSEQGEVVFLNEAEKFSFGRQLTVTIRPPTCEALSITTVYQFDGKAFRPVSSDITRERKVMPELLPFAFFESVLYGGDVTEFLSDELKPKKELLQQYLGSFSEVVIPPESFYLRHPNSLAAGLVYRREKEHATRDDEPLQGNVFDIKFFEVEIEQEKISNIQLVG
jgi:hypothetical protein